jgi:hypothetical protein
MVLEIVAAIPDDILTPRRCRYTGDCCGEARRVQA